MFLNSNLILNKDLFIPLVVGIYSTLCLYIERKMLIKLKTRIWTKENIISVVKLIKQVMEFIGNNIAKVSGFICSFI